MGSGFFCQWLNVTNEKEVWLFSEGLEKNAERTSFYFYCRGSVNQEACKTTKNKILLENKNGHIWKSGHQPAAQRWCEGMVPHTEGSLEEKSGRWCLVMGDLQQS